MPDHTEALKEDNHQIAVRIPRGWLPRLTTQMKRDAKQLQTVNANSRAALGRYLYALYIAGKVPLE